MTSLTDLDLDKKIRAQRFGELVIIVRWWIGIVLDNEIMHFLIDLISSNACLDQWMTVVQGLTSQYGYLSDHLDLLWGFDLDLFLELWLLLLFRNRCVIVIWFCDLFGNWTLCRNYSWPQGSCELECFVFFLGLLLFRNVTQFMNWPRCLETILGAEKWWI